MSPLTRLGSLVSTYRD